MKYPKQCSVCGEAAGYFAQWPNRDNGFGLCRRCFEWLRDVRKMDAEEIRWLYGEEGKHFATAVRPSRCVDGSAAL